MIPDIYEFMIKFDKLISKKDAYTAQHSRAVCRFAMEIGKRIGLNKSDEVFKHIDNL